MSEEGSDPRLWSAKKHLAVLAETAVMSQAEFSEYCRRTGVRAELLEQWRADFIEAISRREAAEKAETLALRNDRKRTRGRERGLRRRDNKRAEAPVVLVLSEKGAAFSPVRGDEGENG